MLRILNLRRVCGCAAYLKSFGAAGSRGKIVFRLNRFCALFFGHQLHGHTIDKGNVYSAVITSEGLATISGDWGELTAAMTSFKGDDICFSETGAGSFCASILQNPGGMRAVENEYIWLDRTGAFPFSQIK